MSIDEVWGGFFKAEIKTSGRKLFAQEKVSVATGSDTAIQAYVRVAPPAKVSLIAEDISSRTFTADCTCPAASKSQFCKHIWAALLCVEQKYPDFLSSKRIIDKPSDKPVESPENPSSPSAQTKPSRESYQAQAKLRAADYRKEQYQKHKQRAKDLKRGSKGQVSSKIARALPADVEASLTYFAVNGFPMPDGPSEAVLSEAKRKLSRVFHPDKGGSNEEVVELNHHCDLLLRFQRS